MNRSIPYAVYTACVCICMYAYVTEPQYKINSILYLYNVNELGESIFFFCVCVCVSAYAAMKTATMDCFSFGFVSASWMKRSVMRAT